MPDVAQGYVDQCSSPFKAEWRLILMPSGINIKAFLVLLLDIQIFRAAVGQVAAESAPHYSIGSV